MKFKLMGTHPAEEYDTERKVILTFDRDHLDDVLTEIRAFLLGCGFSIDGPIVVDEWPEDTK